MRSRGSDVPTGTAKRAGANWFPATARVLPLAHADRHAHAQLSPRRAVRLVVSAQPAGHPRDERVVQPPVGASCRPPAASVDRHAQRVEAQAPATPAHDRRERLADRRSMRRSDSTDRRISRAEARGRAQAVRARSRRRAAPPELPAPLVTERVDEPRSLWLQGAVSGAAAAPPSRRRAPRPCAPPLPPSSAPGPRRPTANGVASSSAAAPAGDPSSTYSSQSGRARVEAAHHHRPAQSSTARSSPSPGARSQRHVERGRSPDRPPSAAARSRPGSTSPAAAAADRARGALDLPLEAPAIGRAIEPPDHGRWSSAAADPSRCAT